MAIDDVTPAYVDLLSDSKYTTRTANATEFDALKLMYTVYLNSNPSAVPDKKYTHGLALLILHHYAMDDTQAPDSGGSDQPRGSIANESVGDVSIGYGSGGVPAMGSVQGWKSWLVLSRWGTEFLYMMNTFRATPLVT